MPRVVPSQVVALIERLFPSHVQRSQDLILSRGHAGQLMAIIELIDKIPQELITLKGPDYTNLVVGINTLRQALVQWQMRDEPIRGVPGYEGTGPIALIQQSLRKCKDEFPSPETTSLSFIRDDELRGHLRLDIGIANRALANSEWKAATVLAGSVIEALLLWALEKRSEGDIWEAVDRLTKKKDLNTGRTILGRKPREDLKEWHLSEYIEVAADLKLITEDTAAQARLAKDFRNLIHPGRAARLGQMCDRG